MKREGIHIEYNDLINIVFAIIISNAIIKLPLLFQLYFTLFQTEDIISISLLFSTIIFSVLYWIETREFIRNENLLAQEKGMKIKSDIYASRFFMLGSLLLVIFSVVMIEFSNFKSFNKYIIINFLFWISDYFGTLQLKRSYHVNISFFNNHCRNYKLSSWFIAHFDTLFFNIYGLLNSLFYFSIFILSYIVDYTILIKLLISILLLVFVIFRHFYWRITMYRKHQIKVLKELKKKRKQLIKCTQLNVLGDLL